MIAVLPIVAVCLTCVCVYVYAVCLTWLTHASLFHSGFELAPSDVAVLISGENPPLCLHSLAGSRYSCGIEYTMISSYPWFVFESLGGANVPSISSPRRPEDPVPHRVSQAVGRIDVTMVSSVLLEP